MTQDLGYPCLDCYSLASTSIFVTACILLISVSEIISLRNKVETYPDISNMSHGLF